MKDLTLNISAALAKRTTAEGNVVGLEKGSYESTLGQSDLDKETAARVHTHDKHYIAGGVKALGERAVEVLKDNPEYNNVEGSFAVGNSTVKTVVERTGEVSAPPAKKGEAATTKEVIGYTTARITTKVGTELKSVRDHIAAQAEREFK